MNILPVYFRAEEFRCRCGCGESAVSAALVLRLEALRGLCGPLRITSGRRCAAHNAAVGGAEFSRHMAGLAADVVPLSCSMEDFFLLASLFFFPKRDGGPDELIKYRGYCHLAVGRDRGNFWTGGQIKI